MLMSRPSFFLLRRKNFKAWTIGFEQIPSCCVRENLVRSKKIIGKSRYGSEAVRPPLRWHATTALKLQIGTPKSSTFIFKIPIQQKLVSPQIIIQISKYRTCPLYHSFVSKTISAIGWNLKVSGHVTCYITGIEDAITSSTPCFTDCLSHICMARICINCTEDCQSCFQCNGQIVPYSFKIYVSFFPFCSLSWFCTQMNSIFSWYYQLFRIIQKKSRIMNFPYFFVNPKIWLLRGNICVVSKVNIFRQHMKLWGFGHICDLNYLRVLGILAAIYDFIIIWNAVRIKVDIFMFRSTRVLNSAIERVSDAVGIVATFSSNPHCLLLRIEIISQSCSFLSCLERTLKSL